MANDAELQEFLPRLYETFLAECWLLRDRIVPLRCDTQEGLQEVARAGLTPEVVYIDADHRYDAVKADLETALDLFPAAQVAGDDFDWPEVRRAVEDVCRERGLKYEAGGSGWRIVSAAAAGEGRGVGRPAAPGTPASAADAPTVPDTSGTGEATIPPLP